MRTVLDTNLIVSAFLTPGGVGSLVIRHWLLQDFDLLMSDDLLDEIKDVLSRRKHAARLDSQNSEIRGFYTVINRRATFPDRIPHIPPLAADPKDTMVLALAIAGNADVIVSGDRHLRDLEMYEGIPILSPRQFLQLLESSEK